MGWICRAVPLLAKRLAWPMYRPRPAARLPLRLLACGHPGLLRLPSFLVGGNEAGRCGLARRAPLTGHFLARDAFGHHHRPLPAGAPDAIRPGGGAGRQNRSSRMPDDLIGHIEDTRLSDALSERYLVYALSTIMSRSLPDVRDGLKPVHRRLIYAMHLLRLDPIGRFQEMRPRRGRRDGQIPSAWRRLDLRRAWCGWRRNSPRGTRWWKGRAISATSTAITRRRCATPKRG